MLFEGEVLRAVLAVHDASAAQKYIEEVCWRTYWKGFLQRVPSIWHRHVNEVRSLVAEQETQPWSRTYAQALQGTTGIACFDDWSRTLQTHGYLHNHVRMWFASIWIFTLNLPWQLGAAFFLRHLLDADAASNTLSWRWVAGLHTKGKTYLARADNIAQYTDGLYAPQGLSLTAEALTEAPLPKATPLALPVHATTGTVGLLMHDDDLSVEQLSFTKLTVAALGQLKTPASQWPTAPAEARAAFVTLARTDAAQRAETFFERNVTCFPEEEVETAADRVANWARQNQLHQLVAAYPPVGATADFFAALRERLLRLGFPLHFLLRPYDALAWPYANAGFFQFRACIPQLCQLQRA